MSNTLFCLDFDETLSNTDRLRADLSAGIRDIGGAPLSTAYLETYETVRREQGGVNIPLVLKELGERSDTHNEALQLAAFFHAFPYQDYLYPEAEKVVYHLKKQGSVILFSDGDAFFQPQKIYATKIAAMVHGIIILPNKTDRFRELEGFWPAERYVFIDDKQRVLNAAKAHFGNKATTVLVKQGRYAEETESTTADLTAGSITEVQHLFPV